jgi:2-C-methyl-D-erythritol 4-phosphate cytidylyltransferase
MKAVAIILASGSGQRFGSQSAPKHLTPILGIPILAWTLNSIVISNIFQSTIVVTSKDDFGKTEKVIKEFFPKTNQGITVTEGSTERKKSFLCGLDALVNSNSVCDETVVSLVDANRPFTPIKQLESLYSAAIDFGCSCPARPLVNGVAKMHLKRIIDVPDKSSYFEFVTPEFIRLSDFNKSFKASKEGYSSLVEYALAIGLNPVTLDSDILNTKLTYPEDKTYLEGVALDHELVQPLKVGKLTST